MINKCTTDVLIAKIAELAAKIEERDKHYRELFEAARERVEIAMTAADKALSKAEYTTERRLDTMNEFRGALTDQAATLLPRTEYNLSHIALTERVALNSDRITKLESEKAGGTSSMAIIRSLVLGFVSALGVMIAGAVAIVNWVK